jgi:hypothetical protein
MVRSPVACNVHTGYELQGYQWENLISAHIMTLWPNEVNVTRIRIIPHSDDLVPEAIWR